MNSENELKRLESFVAKLLKSFQDLKDENGKLQRDLQAREETIAELREQLAENDSERSEISSRVSNLIEQIEEWEVNLGEEVLETVTAAPANDASRQGSLFGSVKKESAPAAQETGTGSYGE